MEKYLNSKVIIRGKEFFIKSISAEEMIVTVVDNQNKEFSFSFVAFEKGTIRFVDPSLQETAIKDFNDVIFANQKLEDELSEAEELKRKYEAFCRQRRESGNSNVAIKCTYCDGGSSATSIGFKGVCSDLIRNFNIEKRAWCSRECCYCKQLSEGSINVSDFTNHVKNGDFICYEYNMLNNWEVYGGIDKNGNPMAIKDCRCGSMVVLTTRPIDANSVETPEENRIIFGVFLADFFSENTDRGGLLTAQDEFRIELTPTEANNMKFWKYYSNENSENSNLFWGTGLHRFLSDMQCCQILSDIIDIIKDSDREQKARNILNRFMQDTGINNIVKPNGSLS